MKGSRIDVEKPAGISNEFENSLFYYDLYHARFSKKLRRRNYYLSPPHNEKRVPRQTLPLGTQLKYSSLVDLNLEMNLYSQLYRFFRLIGLFSFFSRCPRGG